MTNILSNDLLTLRSPEPEDLDILYLWENDTATWEISSILKPFSKFTLKQYIANSHQDIFTAKQVRFMITHTKDSVPVGCIDIYDFDPIHRRAGIGILIDISKRKNGYASLALKMILDYSFNILKLYQLYCCIPIDNSDSIKLFTNHEFEKTGVKKEWLHTSQGWKDEVFLQLINK